VKEPLIKVERKENVAWITLNSPENMNAMSISLLSELDRVTEEIRSDEAIRCVVITGSGRAFSAGGDLRGFQEDLGKPTTEPFLERLRYGQRVFEKIETLPMPVIAAVNGFAIAGGLELVLCCDIVVAAETARIGDGHARFGIIPAGGSSVRLPRKISANRASYMLLTAELFPAKTLQEWGLINIVVEDSNLVTAVGELSRAIATHSPYGLRLIKKLISTSVEIPADAAAQAEIEAFTEYARSHDLSEGLAAFVEKRAPVFIGR
jgi:enoyl-CoA hydratase/carnithine racemase